MNPEVLIQNQEKAEELYSSLPPSLIGRFKLSLASSEKLPIDLGEVYGVVNEQIESRQTESLQWARTFGALSVNTALDNSNTSFAFESPTKFQDKTQTEISTLAKYTLKDHFSMQEQDTPVAYLIAQRADKPIATQFALIQALHLVDTSIVTDQFQPELPLVRVVDISELLELKQKFPETFLRLYGNKRNVPEAPQIIGSVVSTSILETSGINTESIEETAQNKEQEDRYTSANFSPNPNQPKASFVGITTAKRPHIGHSFLIAKAIAESETKEVVIELNDQGPRVDAAICKIAESLDITLEEAAARVTGDEVSFNEIEDAYKSRGDIKPQTKLPAYSLTSANSYYKKILEDLKPANVQFIYSADSELEPYYKNLRNNQGYKTLFSDNGMSVMAGLNSPAVLIKSGGKLEVPGIISALASKFNLKLVDSPPPLTKREQKTLNFNNIAVEQNSGSGMMIDFEIVSGSNGKGILIDSVMELFDETQLDKTLFLPAIRQVMDDGFAFEGEKGSFCTNFASQEAFQEAFLDAVCRIKELPNPEEILNKKITYKNVLKEMLKEITAPVYSSQKSQGRISIKEVQSLLEIFPVLEAMLSISLVEYVDRAKDDSAINVPRNIKTEEDDHLISVIRSTNPEKLTNLIAEQSKTDYRFASTVMSDTNLGMAIQKMGYNIDDLPDALNKVAAAKGLFKIS